MSFDFEKFEKHIPEFSISLAKLLRKNLFKGVAPDFELTVGIEERPHGKKIFIETSDLVDDLNFRMFKRVYIHNFGGNEDQKAEHPCYWLPIDWRWESLDGGGNGTRALTVYLDDEGRIISEKI